MMNVSLVASCVFRKHLVITVANFTMHIEERIMNAMG